MNSILHAFCFSCHHVIHLETASDKSEIREWRTAENFKAKVEIWVSYCHNCESLETVTSGSLRDIRKVEEHLWISLKGLLKEIESRQMGKGTRTGCVLRRREKEIPRAWDNL